VSVNQYADRYVISDARGIYVVGRLANGTVPPCCSYPDHYFGPGYVGQFAPADGPQSHQKMVVNDALASGPIGPRDGVHGGLGCFSMDFYRVGTGLVDLNCRRLSPRSGAGSAGVDAVDAETVTLNTDGVTLSLRTRYRDSVNTAFYVTYTHRFTPSNVSTTVTWQSWTNDVVYVKEPRIVSVLGTAEVPIYTGQGQYRPPSSCAPPTPDGTYGYGDGVWGLEPDLLRKDYKPGHYWPMDDVVPWCSTITVGPGATGADRRYHRGGFSFDVGSSQYERNLSVEDPGYFHDYDGPTQPTKNFNGWRRQADPSPGIPQGTLTPCPGGDVPKSACPVAIGSSQSICESCAANAWELGRVPGQYGVFVAMEAWRASVNIWNFLERSRRLPAQGTTYSESFRF